MRSAAILFACLFSAAVAAAAEPPEDVARTIQAIADLRQTGDLKSAARCASDLVAKHPEDLDAHVALQDLEIALGRDKETIETYRAAAKAPTAGADAHYLLGRLLRGPAAAAEFRAAVAVDPNHFWALCGLGVELTHAGNFDEAQVVLASAAKLRPKSAVPLNAMGRLEESRGHGAAAEKLYRDAIALAPETTSARVNLGVLLVGLGKGKDALEILEDAAKRAPKDPMPLVAIGMAAMSADDPPAAVAAYKRALAVAADDVTTLNLIANAYMNLDQLDLAEQALVQALAKAPDVATTRLNFVQLRLAQKDVDAAAALATAAVAADDSSADAHFLLGLVFDHQANARKAENEFRKAAKLDETNPVYPRALGALAESQNEWSKAIAEYQKVVKMTGGAADALMDLASAYSGAVRPLLAAQTYDEVLAVDAARLEAWLELGIVCRRDLKDDKRAAAAFREYVKRGGSDERVPKWLTQIEK